MNPTRITQSNNTIDFNRQEVECIVKSTNTGIVLSFTSVTSYNHKSDKKRLNQTTSRNEWGNKGYRQSTITHILTLHCDLCIVDTHTNPKSTLVSSKICLQTKENSNTNIEYKPILHNKSGHLSKR